MRTTLRVLLFNGHSFRLGAATAVAQAGIPDSTIFFHLYNLIFLFMSY